MSDSSSTEKSFKLSATHLYLAVVVITSLQLIFGRIANIYTFNATFLCLFSAVMLFLRTSKADQVWQPNLKTVQIVYLSLVGFSIFFLIISGEVLEIDAFSFIDLIVLAIIAIAIFFVDTSTKNITIKQVNQLTNCELKSKLDVIKKKINPA